MALHQIGLQSPVDSHRDINDRNVGLNNFISKFADYSKIGNSIITGHDKVNLQKDLRNSSEWSQRWEISFNINKYYILHVSTKHKKLNTR